MHEIQMPKLSDTMTEGTLVAWKKKKGDTVSAGEVIAAAPLIRRLIALLPETRVLVTTMTPTDVQTSLIR